MKESGFTIYNNLTIHAPVERVFEAISEPRHLINWWPQRCTGNPELGGAYNFYFTPEYDWYGEVSQIEKPHSFYIKMTQADIDWDPTTFGFDLEEENSKTQVRFSHYNWPNCNDHFKIASYCWAVLLKGLKDYLERGDIVPFEKRS